MFCVLFSAVDTYAQTSVWRYVVTIPGGSKAYLSDGLKTLSNKNKTAWEKITDSDGSFAIALSEWDCPNKRRMTREVTFYLADGKVRSTQKRAPRWDEVIPGSMADYFYRRVCFPQPAGKWAVITTARTDLRFLPNNTAPVTRIAKKGEKFQIVPESGGGGWFNVVDSKTQEDYWLLNDSFETITNLPLKARAGAKITKAVGKAKKTLPKKRLKKNR